MIGPDQDLSDFPPWIWPYIDIARLARGEARTSSQASAANATPGFATAARVAVLIAAATVKHIAGGIKDEKIRGELTAAASATLAAEGDDLCPPPRKWPWPHPRRDLELLELAAHVALAAAATGDKVVGHELTQIATRFAEQAQKD